jgi:hypothetical protein
MRIRATHESQSNKVLPVTEVELTALRRESIASVDIHRRGSVTGAGRTIVLPPREPSVPGCSEDVEPERAAPLEGAPAWAEVEPMPTAT